MLFDFYLIINYNLVLGGIDSYVLVLVGSRNGVGFVGIVFLGYSVVVVYFDEFVGEGSVRS